MATARFYDESKHDGSQPWIALADIDEAEWEALPKHVQRSIDTLPYFRKTKPESARTHRATKVDEKEEAG
jgi:hypothetical protein